MTTIKDYATLSNLVYQPNGGSPDPSTGWRRIVDSGDMGSGYFGAAYYNDQTKELVIAHRGTQLLTDAGDLKSDWQTLAGLTPNQYPDAETFYAVVQQRIAIDPTLTGATISHTGHSLGGAIARYLAAKESQVGVLFNAFGVTNSTTQLPPNPDLSQITAINAKYDKISELGAHDYPVVEKYISYVPGVPDSWEPLLALLTFKIPLLGLLVNSHYYYDQHSMDSLLAVIAADPSLARLDPATGPLDVTADGEIVGAGLTEWADLEAALTADPGLWSGGLLPEDELTSAQIRTEQNVDPATPIIYDHTGPATWIVGENGADILSGDAGNDLIFGDAGDDTLDGEGGNDILIGGWGFDTYLLGQGSDTIIDTDGRGQLRYVSGDQSQLLILGIRESTDPQGQYTSPDDALTFVWSGTSGDDLTVHAAGGTAPAPTSEFHGTANNDADLIDTGVPLGVAGGGVLNSHWTDTINRRAA